MIRAFAPFAGIWARRPPADLAARAVAETALVAIIMTWQENFPQVKVRETPSA